MKKLLVVVDYQNDFISGSLGFKGAEDISKNIVSLIKEFEKNGDDIVFTMDEHDDNYFETIEGKNLPIMHCKKDTAGYELHNSLLIYKDKYPMFSKPCFGSSKLGAHIRTIGYDEVHLCGLMSDICVFTNAIISKVFSGVNTRVVVRKNASATSDKEFEDNAYAMLKHLHIEII